MKLVIIGSGSWGTALAQTAKDNGHEVVIYGIQSDEVRDINTNHRNSKYFPKVNINPELYATSSLREAMAIEPDMVLLAVPTFAIEGVCEEIVPTLKKKTIFINVAKGFNPRTDERLSEVIRRVVPTGKLSSVVSLIGPSHAEEVILRLLTTVSAVSQKEDDAKAVQEVFSNEYFRVYTGTDEIGSEIGVAIKNVLAIASGIAHGLGYGDNTRASLITRGLQEMMRFGIVHGGKERTYMGLTGVGDLIVTCSSIHSRNFQAGSRIGMDDSAKDFLSTNKKTVEGIRTAQIVHDIAEREHIDMPICEEVYQVLYMNKKPTTAITDLMSRDLKGE